MKLTDSDLIDEYGTACALYATALPSDKLEYRRDRDRARADLAARIEALYNIPNSSTEGGVAQVSP